MNSTDVITVFCIAFLLGLFAWYRFHRKVTFTVPAFFDFHYRTPFGITSGAYVMSNVAVPDEALVAIEAGIACQTTRSSEAHPEWKNYGHLFDYTVFFIDPMITNLETSPGSPAIIVNGVQSAGSCTGVGAAFKDATSTNDRPAIVLPHQAASNWQYLEYLQESVRFESEHIRLWTNDPDLFHFYTGGNDKHPIFP